MPKIYIHSARCRTRRPPRTAAALVLGIFTVSLLSPTPLIASSWNPTLLVNTEAFQIVHEGDSAAGTDVELRFGDTLSEKIYWDRTNSEFRFSDDIRADGNITGSGKLVITSTARFNSGAIIARAQDSEFIQFKDTTNGKNVGMYTGSGSPESVVAAGPASLYSDHQNGRIYKKNSGTGNTGWVELTAGSGSVHMAKMTRNASQSIPAGAFVKMYLDTEEFDVGGIANATAGATGSGRFTIGKAGKYLITAGWTTTTTPTVGAGIVSSIYRNNARVRYAFQRASGGATTQGDIADVIDLSAGDFLEFFVYSDTATSTQTSTDITPHMSIVQLQDNQGSNFWTMSGSTIYNNNAGNVGIGANQPTTKLEVVGTASGDHLFAQRLLTVSGAVRVSSGATLNEDLDNSDVGLVFGSDTLSESLAWVNLADRFEFSDDVRITGGIYASGALIVDGATILKSTLKLNGVTYTFPTSDGSASGKVLKTSGAGVLSWSADANDGGISYANAKSYFVDDSGDSMTGALLIQMKTNGAAATADAGVQLEVVGTISGAVLYASSGVNSSGAVIIKTPVTTSATLGGTGALVVMQRIELGTGAYMSASGAAILALNSPVQGDTAPAPSNTPHIVFGYQGAFDTNLYRMTGSVLRTDDHLSIGGDVAVNEAITTLESSNIPAGSIVIGDGILCIDDGGSNCDDSARAAGTMYSVNVAVTPLDLAENYPTKDATLAAGELVVLDPLLPFFVKRAGGGSNETVIGVVSTAPGIILGGFDEGRFANERQVPIALAGRVPVRVHAEGGPIAIGDPLTLSSVAGIAMKATDGGPTIGKALEAYRGGTVGMVMTFINNDSAAPDDASRRLRELEERTRALEERIMSRRE